MSDPLRILHILRAPVGGLFRHVADLAVAQADLGHAVGVIADSNTGGDTAAKKLNEFSGKLTLGVTRVPMSRDIGISDGAAIRHVAERAANTGANILHGHGAKGGAYARLARANAIRVYTPHGGSLHYSVTSPVGFAYIAAERLMKARTDLFLFESEYALDTFTKKLGPPKHAKVVHNGIRADELVRVEPEADAADFIYLGELRMLKGPDVLIDALGILAQKGWSGSALLYGDGPDRDLLAEKVAALGLAHQIGFPGPMPAREAFATGRVLVLPSRAESLPYVALEAAGAQIPLLATNVGGLPEIFGEDSRRLVKPGDPAALADAMSKMLNEPNNAFVQRLHSRIASQFSVASMTASVLSAYAEA